MTHLIDPWGYPFQTVVWNRPRHRRVSGFKETPVRKTLAILTVTLLGSIASRAQTPAPPPATSNLDLQLLAEALRTASTFHDLVKNLNANVARNLSADAAAQSPAPSLDRTAAIVGAAAGAGAALGELHGSQKSVIVGVIAGAASGLVIDQIVRHHQETAKARAAGQPADPQ